MFKSKPSFLSILLVTLTFFFLASCSRISEQNFIGKWQSSRTLTPLHLHGNGEWEIKTEEGVVLQYGIWCYENKTIIWTIKQDSQIMDDVNPVLSVGTDEFKLKEQNGSTTTFKRIR